MIRFGSTSTPIALPIAAALPAFAEPIETVEHFPVGHCAKVIDRVTVHAKTGVVDTHVVLAEADGKTETGSGKGTPAAAGGCSCSETITGFGGVPETSSGTVGAHGS